MSGQPIPRHGKIKSKRSDLAPTSSIPAVPARFGVPPFRRLVIRTRELLLPERLAACRRDSEPPHAHTHGLLALGPKSADKGPDWTPPPYFALSQLPYPNAHPNSSRTATC